MDGMFKKLTHQDIEEGKKFLNLFSGLAEQERMQVKIYAQALADRNEIAEGMELKREVV